MGKHVKTIQQLLPCKADADIAFADLLLVLGFDERISGDHHIFSKHVAIETTRIGLPRRPADHLIAATARVFDLKLVTADARLLGADGVATLANGG